MEDNPNPAPQPDPPEQTPEQQESAFWDKFDKRLDGRLDAWFEGKVKKYREQGTSRTGGRTTLPGIIADLMFGKEAK